MITDTDIVHAVNAARGIEPINKKEQKTTRQNEHIKRAIQHGFEIKSSTIRNKPAPSAFFFGSILLGVVLFCAFILHIAGPAIEGL